MKLFHIRALIIIFPSCKVTEMIDSGTHDTIKVIGIGISMEITVMSTQHIFGLKLQLTNYAQIYTKT
jgi:hypothetical protein